MAHAKTLSPDIYVVHEGKNPDNEQLNVYVGMQIRKLRKHKGLTQGGDAKISRAAVEGRQKDSGW